MMDPWLFMFLFSLIGRFLFYCIDQASGPEIPKNLLRLKAGFEKGKPNRRFWNTLRAQPGYQDYYRLAPGRLSCTVLPLEVHGENHWQLRVGFKKTADSRPSFYMSIPVYKNGQILDV